MVIFEHILPLATVPFSLVQNAVTEICSSEISIIKS